MYTDATFLLPTLAQLIILTHKYKRECPKILQQSLYSLANMAILNIQHWMQVSGWFHSLIALPWFPLDRRLGRLYSWCKPMRKRKLSTLTGNQSRFPGHPACRLVAILTELCGSSRTIKSKSQFSLKPR